jgi:cyclic beta-1,2-glucan synthetase
MQQRVTTRLLFDLINPITHADTREKVGRYKVEPYVLAADVYNVPSNQGRGGWTRYTGSSGWLLRLDWKGYWAYANR